MQYLKTTDANYLEVNEENNMGELEDKLFISYRGILYTLRDKKIFNIIERKPEDNSGIQSLESMVKNIVGEDATIGNNIKGMFANEDRGELSIAKLIKRGEGQVEAFEAYDFCYIDLDEDAINVASIDIHRESWLNYGESKQYDFDWSLNSSLSNTLGNVSYTRIVKSLRDEISMQVLFSKNQGNTINPESLATIRETSIYTNELPSRIESNNEAKIKKMKSLNFPRVMDDIFAKDLKEAKAKRVIYAVLCLVVFGMLLFPPSGAAFGAAALAYTAFMSLLSIGLGYCALSCHLKVNKLNRQISHREILNVTNAVSSMPASTLDTTNAAAMRMNAAVRFSSDNSVSSDITMKKE